MTDQQSAEEAAEQIRQQAVLHRQETRIKIGQVFNGPVVVAGDFNVSSD